MSKKIIKENDIYTPEEFQIFEEYQSFPSEQYSYKEVTKQKMEYYETEEIKKVSFVKDKTQKEFKKDNSFKKIKEHIVKTTSSAGLVSTVSSIAVIFAGAGVIGTIPFIGGNPDNFGSFAFNNQVRSEMFKTTNDSNEEINFISELLVYSECDLNEGYNLDVNLFASINEEDLTFPGLYDQNLRAFRFLNIELDSDIDVIDIKVNIYKDNDVATPVETFKKSINYVSSYTIENQGLFEYFVSFNEDGSTNAYFYRKNQDLNAKYEEELKETVQIVDKNNEILKEYSISDIETINENLFKIEDIPYQTYTLKNKIYYIQNECEYLLRSNEILDISSKELTETYLKINNYDSLFDMYLFFNINEEYQMDILFLDSGNQTDTYIDGSSSFSRFRYHYDIVSDEKAVKISINFTNINPYFSNYYDRFMDESIIKGETLHTYPYEKIIEIKDRNLDLDLDNFIIMVENSYNNYSCGLTFDCEYSDSFIRVDVLDLENNLVDSSYSNTGSLFYFYNLDRSTTYSFEYYFCDSNGESIGGDKKSYQTSLSNPYNNLDVSYRSTNPSDIPYSINTDKTYNIYLTTNFVNNTSLDIYHGVVLSNNIINNMILTKSNAIAVENLYGNWSLSYGAYIIDEEDPKKLYAVKEITRPSGVVGEDIASFLKNQGYPHLISGNFFLDENDDSKAILVLECKPYTDISYKITLDGDTTNLFEGTISIKDLKYGVIAGYTTEQYYYEFDLTNYTFDTHLTLDINLIASRFTEDEFRNISQFINIKGAVYCSSEQYFALYK